MNIVYNLVGALTIKPYSFKARSWELNYINSIDFFDSVGSNLKLEIRGKKLLRVLSRQNDHLNENWITDKSRFAFDSLVNQRLSTFYVRNFNKESIFTAKNWLNISYLINIEFIFGLFLKKYGKWRINFIGILDEYMSSDQSIFFKDWINIWGSSNLITNLHNNNNWDITFRSNYLFKNTINSILTTDLCVLVNINPRIENPIINLKLRKLYLKNKLTIVSFGRIYNPNYTVKNLGNSTKSFILFIEGRHKFSRKFFQYKKPIFLLGNSVVYRKDNKTLFYLISKLNKIINLNFNIIYNKLSHISAYDQGIIPGTHSLNNYYVHTKNTFAYNIIYNLNNLNLNLKNKEFISMINYLDWVNTDINIYNGSFGGNNLKNYNYLIPLSVLLESNGVFTNINGNKSYIPTILPQYKNSKDFYSIFHLCIVLLKNIKYLNPLTNNLMDSVVFETKTTRLNKLYFNQLAINSNIITSYNYLKSSPFISLLKYGQIYRNLFSVYQDTYYINDLYTSYSNLMLKMKKTYLRISNRNYN